MAARRWRETSQWLLAIATLVSVASPGTSPAADAGRQGEGGEAERTQGAAAEQPEAIDAQAPLPRDPFRPFFARVVTDRGPSGIGPNPRQLTLVATLVDLKPARALLQDDQGMGYIVSPGMHFGDRGEIVSSIDRERVIFQEITLDRYGREKTSEFVIEMDQGGEGGE